MLYGEVNSSKLKSAVSPEKAVMTSSLVNNSGVKIVATCAWLGPSGLMEPVD